MSQFVRLLLILWLSLMLTVPYISAQDATMEPSNDTVSTLDPVSAATNSPVGGTASPPPANNSSSQGWQGCNDPSLGFQLVTIGSPTTVCLVLSSSPDWATSMNYMRLNFSPIADQYSRFHVPRSYQQLIAVQNNNALSNTFPGNITVHAASQTSLSFQKRYFDGFDKVFPYLTAIINVDRGTVTGITWDDACLFCTDNQCEPNTFDFAGNLVTESEALQPVGGCAVVLEECNQMLAQTAAASAAGNEEQAATSAAGCDLLLYVVWTGTDSQGRDFRSAAYRFSAFPAQSWTDRISQNLPDFVPQNEQDLQDLNPIN